MKLRSVLAALALLTAISWSQSAAAAVVVFFDDFDSTTQGLSLTDLPNWTVTGSVDVIGQGSAFDFYPGHGNYVDLNGSNNQIGQLESKTVFGAGTYTLSFLLGGSTGSGGDTSSKATQVSFGVGGFSQLITLAPDAGLNPYSFTFTTAGGNLFFTSVAGGNPNVGNILDNVQVSAVPEPATWILMLLGFAALAGFAYHRSKGLTVAHINALRSL